MLPNLKDLPLTSPSTTDGFYVPSSEELSTINDDPITLAVPLQPVPRTLVEDSDTVLATFRVSLANRGSDGEPRYKYFNPATLWEWVKDNEELPTREGPVWYEDWWALCNQYNPTHSNVPPWAYMLKTEAAYREEEAARIARAQAEAARIAEATRVAMAEAEAAAREATESRARARELDRLARDAEERAAELRRRVNGMTTEPRSGDGLRPSLADVGPSNSEPQFRPITPYDEWPGAPRDPAVYRQSLGEPGPYYRHPSAFDPMDEGPQLRDLAAPPMHQEPPRLRDPGAQQDGEAAPEFRDLGAHDDDENDRPPYRGLSANDSPAPPLQALSAPDDPAPSFMDLSAERADQQFAEQQASVFRGLEYQTRMRDGD